MLRQPVEAEFARGELTGPQRTVMHYLVQAPGMSLKELSASAGFAHSTVSGIVDRLEARGMIVRTVDAADRRKTKLSPSRAVVTFLNERLPGLQADPLLRAFRAASSDERNAIGKGLALLHQRLKDDPTGSD